MSTIASIIDLSSNISQAAPTTLPGGTDLYLNQSSRCNFTSGTLANQCDTLYASTLTLAAVHTALNLQSLLDPFGNAISFARVKYLQVVNTSQTDGHNVLMGYASSTANCFVGFLSNPGQVVIGPSTAANQGVFVATSPNTTGFPVSSSSYLLNFDPQSETITINVTILGCST
jgi:hypothetical protein